MADGYSGLRVLDIHTPDSPLEVGSLAIAGDTRGVALSGGIACTVSPSTLRVIDVSNTSAPSELGSCTLPLQCSSIAISAGHAYVACRQYGLRVIDISVPANPVEVIVVGTGYTNPAAAVAAAGDYLYLAGFTSVEVLDIHDPANPEPVGSTPPRGFPRSVAVAGGYAVVAEDAAGLSLFRIPSLLVDDLESGDLREWSAAVGLAP